jgi:hypothetical protein
MDKVECLTQKEMLFYRVFGLMINLKTDSFKMSNKLYYCSILYIFVKIILIIHLIFLLASNILFTL